MTRLVLVVLLVGLLTPGVLADTSPPAAEAYRSAAAELIGRALTSDRAHARLGVLCDRFGHRLSGTPQLEAAGAWAVAEMERDGLAGARREEVMVPVWVRGRESGRIVAPAEHELTLLGLGGSVGTPESGLEADVLVVGGFEELEALPAERVRGRIVLYDVPFTTYGETVKHRTEGPSRAARRGALAALVRSVGPRSLSTPHAGALRYADDAPKIPAAAITIENATLLRRMAERGDAPRVRLLMEAKTLADAPSANVVAEVPGRERPEEFVLVGGHLDSWDVGQGAQDDGVGCLIAWEAARLILESGVRPRRSIRVVLFTNEENGTRGAKGFAERHAAELPGCVAAIESDSGNGLAQGFRLQVPEPQAPADTALAKEAVATRKAELAAAALARLRELAPLLEPLGSTRMLLGGAGADVGPCVERGVVGLGLDHDTTEYFVIHHTPADTFEKVIKADLDRNVASMAVMAYVLADMPDRLLEPARLVVALPSPSFSPR